MARNDTLVEILRRGAEMVRTKGFQAAGLNDILRAAGVPKGSFYHYFRSKEDFGLTLIDFHAGFLLARMEDVLAEDGRPPLERLREFFRGLGRDMAEDGFSGGFLSGNLAQEMAGQSPAFREKLREVWSALAGHVLRCLEDAVQRGEVAPGTARREVADFILNSWEGAVMRAKVEGGPSPLEEFENIVFSDIPGGWLRLHPGTE